MTTSEYNNSASSFFLNYQIEKFNLAFKCSNTCLDCQSFLDREEIWSPIKFQIFVDSSRREPSHG